MFQIFVDSAANLPAVIAKNIISMSFLLSTWLQGKKLPAIIQIFRPKKSEKKAQSTIMQCVKGVK